MNRIGADQRDTVGVGRPHVPAAARILALSLVAAYGVSGAAVAGVEEFDESFVIVEINATDGDVGFHGLADAGEWRYLRLTDPNGDRILSVKAKKGLRDQGMTEKFFESSEPLCEPDPEEPEERVVTLAEFVERFPAGEYHLVARSLEGDLFISDPELTYDLPAAPDISMTEDMTLPIDDVVVIWEPGEDLGEACHDQSLVDDGTIAEPAEVPVAAWEVVVEVDEDGAPEHVFSVRVPPEQTFASVPADFLQQFLDLGFSEFKFEVGAIGEGGNATFSEGSFEVED